MDIATIRAALGKVIDRIDGLEVDIDHYGPPDATLLRADPRIEADETLRSELLKSNCPVTGHPDWASVRIAYRGARIEQCVERIFVDLLARCRPQSLCVEARYTRRGGLDINPWRATPDRPAPAWRRDLRQ